MRRTGGEAGIVLIVVLLAVLSIELIGIGMLTVVMSDLHGAVANRLAMQSVNVAEAGVNYAVAHLVSRASIDVSGEEGYSGEPTDIAMTGREGRTIGSFRVTVTCVYPRGATPPNCLDDPSTPRVDERNLRHITSLGFGSRGPERARRQIEAIIRRYVPGGGDTPSYGICGRDGVTLDDETTIISDVGSNGDIRVGPSSAIRQWRPVAPPSPPTARGVAPPVGQVGLTGSYSWRVTFVDAAGQESSGSPPTPPVQLSGEDGVLAEIPIGDGAITGRRLYRTRADSAAIGPWYLVAEISDDTAGRYTDLQADDALGPRIPGTVSGSAVAAGTVDCSAGCGTQVDGRVDSHVRDVMCPSFVTPPCLPGTDAAPSEIVQTSSEQEVHWGSLHVGAGNNLSILTLADPRARLHIHVADITLERGAAVVVTGQGLVYIHVSGPIHLGDRAVLGAVDATPTSRLITPSDRIQILSCARDPAFVPAHPEFASVRWDHANRVSAFVFAPEANIVITGAEAVRGAIFGRRVTIRGSGGTVLDATEGIGSENTGARSSPFQYLLRWYDSPTLSP